MFCYSWDLLEDIKSSTDLELCFNGICASYRRLAPHVQFMALVRGEEVFQEFWLFLQASLGVKPVLGLCSSLLRDGSCEGTPIGTKGSDLLLFRTLAAWKRHILKYVKHSNNFCTLAH